MNRGKVFRRVLAIALAMILALMTAGCAAKNKDEAGKSTETKRYTGILSAMDNEIDILLKEAEIDHVETIGSVDYNVGTLKGQPVVIAKAGIGKVLSAAGTTVMINKYNVYQLIFTGIAGGIGDETKVLDEVIATGLVQHDYGMITNDGFEWTGGVSEGDEKIHGENGYYYCDEKMVDMAYKAAVEVIGEEHAFKGIIATGDQFISSDQYSKILRNNFNAIACEMEGASVAAVCKEYEIPFVVVRAMSDKADGQAHETFEHFEDAAADNSSRIVIKMLESMKD